jgi:hypothetical protein
LGSRRSAFDRQNSHQAALSLMHSALEFPVAVFPSLVESCDIITTDGLGCHYAVRCAVPNLSDLSIRSIRSGGLQQLHGQIARLKKWFTNLAQITHFPWSKWGSKWGWQSLRNADKSPLFIQLDKGGSAKTDLNGSRLTSFGSGE